MSKVANNFNFTFGVLSKKQNVLDKGYFYFLAQIIKKINLIEDSDKSRENLKFTIPVTCSNCLTEVRLRLNGARVKIFTTLHRYNEFEVVSSVSSPYSKVDFKLTN